MKFGLVLIQLCVFVFGVSDLVAQTKKFDNHAFSRVFRNNNNNQLLAPTSEIRPFAEYEPTQYLVISDDFYFDAQQVKEQLAIHLPYGVQLIVYAIKSTYAQTFHHFSQFIDPERLTILTMDSEFNLMWARDALPIPILQKDTSQWSLSLIDAKYFYPFEPDQMIADHLNTALYNHPYSYEGGNYLANRLGDCFVIDNKPFPELGNVSASEIPDSIFTEFYGCKELFRLPHYSGLGHIDEHLKFVSDRVVMTDEPQYVDFLESLGYTVHVLPVPVGPFETYINSLIINETVFVPIYNVDTDASVIALYEKLGFLVVPIQSKQLSNEGWGSIHCITMTYPNIERINAMNE